MLSDCTTEDILALGETIKFVSFVLGVVPFGTEITEVSLGKLPRTNVPGALFVVVIVVFGNGNAETGCTVGHLVT